jgi:hypothetical protein
LRESPQSWNLYTYVKNNPLALVDPNGEKAKVKSKHDKETNTTTITITASFALYGADGQNVSAEDLTRQKELLTAGIEQAYNGTYVHNGTTYIIQTQVDVQVFGGESAAVASGADNMVEIGKQTLYDDGGRQLSGNVFNREGENFDRMRISINQGVPGGLQEGADNYMRIYAHEFAHVLGMPDRNEGLFASGGLATRMSQSNFVDLFSQESVLSHAGRPPSGAKLKRGDLKYQSGGGDLYALTGSKILGSTIPNFELRRTGGADITRWVKQTKR